MQQGACHASSQPSHGGMSGMVSIDAGNEQQLLEAVATVGPVAAAVDATSNAFRVSGPLATLLSQHYVYILLSGALHSCI